MEIKTTPDFERVHKIDSKKIKKLLEDKDALIQEGRKSAKRMEELEKEQRKLALKVQKLKDKVVPLVKKYYADMNLTEFEEVVAVEVKDGEVIVKIDDVIELYRAHYLEKKYEGSKEANTNEKDSKGADVGGKDGKK